MLFDRHINLFQKSESFILKVKYQLFRIALKSNIHFKVEWNLNFYKRQKN